MFAKLALRNVRRQIQNYLIYFVTVAMSVALMFAVNNLSCNTALKEIIKDSTDMETTFKVVTILASFVTALVLSYATGYMLKLRRREFGMYLTLGMTRKNIRTLFVCETGILSGLAMILGTGIGLVIFQFLMALFSNIMDMEFEIAPYSVQGFLLTVGVSAGLFVVSSIASVRYLGKVTMAELLRDKEPERGERHFGFWTMVSVLGVLAFIFCMYMSYESLMLAFEDSEHMSLFGWMIADLVVIYLLHTGCSRCLSGVLLRNRRWKNRGTNVVVFRGFSEKITVNSMLIGALATLLVFAIVMANVVFGEKIRSDLSLQKDCPFDILAQYDANQESKLSPQEGRKIIEKYSPIEAELPYALYTTYESTLVSGIVGYDVMKWVDTYMPLSTFNRLAEHSGYEPVTLDGQYMMISTAREMCNEDLSDKSVTLNGRTYTWAGSTDYYPRFNSEWIYFVIPDEALEGLAVSDTCVGMTLGNKRFDATALVDELHYEVETEYGKEEKSDYRVLEYHRVYSNATVGTLIIGSLYVATVYVCMVLSILSVKTLSTLEDEKKRFAMLYRLGADGRMQKKALFLEIGGFFLLPFALPVSVSVPVGIIFAKVYEIWNIPGLSGMKAVETAAVIALVVAGIYALYFLLTYRIACNYVICHGSEK